MSLAPSWTDKPVLLAPASAFVFTTSIWLFVPPPRPPTRVVEVTVLVVKFARVAVGLAATDGMLVVPLTLEQVASGESQNSIEICLILATSAVVSNVQVNWVV